MDDMRKFMSLMEFSDHEAPVMASVHNNEVKIDIPSRLEDIVFRLRSYSETTGGDYSDGFEDGLEMAAEMIENLLNSIKGE